MANFVDNDTALPASKVDLNPPSAAAVNVVAAADINAINQNLADIRTVILRQVNIMSFGADPTGSTDNSAAFVAALAALSSGGVLHLSAGTYLLSNSISIPANVTLSFDNAVINIANGKQIFCRGSIVAPHQRIFSYAATPSVEPVYYIGAGPVSIKWWGAVGDGVTDDTAAIQRAFFDIQPQPGTAPGEDPIYYSPITFFPSGQYNVSSALTLGSACHIVGEPALIVGTNPANDIFLGTGYRGQIENMGFSEGFNGINISGGDVDLDTWVISKCAFFHQNNYGIYANRSSTSVTVKDCNFSEDNSSGQGCCYVQCDEFSVYDGWMTMSTPYGFNVQGADFSVMRLTGVTSTRTGVWINANLGPQIFIYQCRFGGESGGRPLLVWGGSTDVLANLNTTPGFASGQFVCEDSNCYSFTNPIMSFNDLPAYIRITGNTGFSDSNGIHLDTSIPLAARTSQQYYGYDINMPGIAADSTSDPECVDRFFYSQKSTAVSLPVESDLIVTIPTNTGGYTPDGNASGVTFVNGTTAYGASNTVVTVTNASNNFRLLFHTALAGLAAGPYTAYFDVQLFTGSITAGFVVGEYQRNVALGEVGAHHIPVPFYINPARVGAAQWLASTAYALGNVVTNPLHGPYDPTAVWQCIAAGTSASSGGPGSTSAAGQTPGVVVDGGVTWAWCGNATAGQIIGGSVGANYTVNGIRIFKGHPNVTTANTIVTGTAAPTTGQWYQGDKVINTQPTFGGIEAWVCTAAGTPGTWQPVTSNSKVSITGFGGDPTNTNDNTSALSAAVSALGTGGGTIYFPKGTYKFATTSTVFPAGVELDLSDAKIHIPTGVTNIQFNGTVRAGLRQIFILDNPSAGPIRFYGNQASVPVQWFGADSTGVSASDSAIQQACTAVAGTEINPGSGYLLSQPEVYFPPGQYLITAPISPSGNIRGENAILTAANSSVNFFTGIGFQFRCRGISFSGGNNAFTVNANQVTATVWIDNCVFEELHGAALYTDPYCDNTYITMTNCLVNNYTNTTATITTLYSGGSVQLTGWGGGVAGSTVFYVNGANLYLDEMSLSPNTTGGQWVDVEGGSLLSIRRTRFGGEVGGKTIVKWNALVPAASLYAPTTVVDNQLTIENCQLYSDSGVHTFAFYTLPQSLRLTGNTGMLGDGIYFDAGIPVDQRQQIQALFTHEVASLGIGKNQISAASDPEVTDRYLKRIAHTPGVTLASDQALSWAFSDNVFTPNQGASGISLASPSVPPGNGPFGVNGMTFTAGGSSSNNAYRNFTTALTGLAVGPYSAVFETVSCSTPLEVLFHAAGLSQHITVPVGSSNITLPFYKGFADPAAWVANTAYSAGQKVLGDGVNIFQCIAPGTSSATNYPSGNSTGYAPFDTKSWATSTAFATHTFCRNGVGLNYNGNVYYAVVGGTSAASGTGPLSGSNSISDGSITWAYCNQWGALGNYGVGSYALNNGNLYVVTGAGYAGVFGPSGTGTGIVDGQVTWNYVAPGPLQWEYVSGLDLGINLSSMPASSSIIFGKVQVFKNHPVLQSTNSIVYAASIPTTGTWHIGDLCYNTAPASAGYVGWVCTVAGSPGTWKTFGLIS